jgi:hypothetical protein
MSGAGSMHGEMLNTCRISINVPEEKKSLVSLGVDWKVLNIFNAWGVD